jgi:ABC-type phosphate transport system substrate-binding protein
MLLASTAYAQNIPPQFVGAGSSAMFITFGFAARIGPTPCGDHNWSKKNGATINDSRGGGIVPVETGNVWVVWDDTPEPNRNVCVYVSVDSGVGVRAFFAVPTATVAVDPILSGNPGDQLVPLPLMPADEASLPANIQADINGQAVNAAMTDIRPEDALFATNRALAPLDPARNGLGYGPGPVGSPILSAFSGKKATPVAFALSGVDPISGSPIGFNYATTSVGASPVMVFVNITNNAVGHFGQSGAFVNINRFILARVLNGTLTRIHDIEIKDCCDPAFPLHAMLREPLSGTYNTMEFNIPRSAEIGTSQEIGVTPPADNPLNQTAADGATRQRVIGTGEMVTEVTNTPDSIGYAFWGFGNFASAATQANTRYITVDSVDPIQSERTTGQFPTCAVAPCHPAAFNFFGLKYGGYPIWTYLRVVTVKPVPAGVLSLINDARNEAANIPDFVASNNLNIFRSHYTQVGVAPHNGHLAGFPESGGDVGGAVYIVGADKDFILDTGLELLEEKQ